MKNKIQKMTSLRNVNSIDIINYIKSVSGRNDKIKTLKLALETNNNFLAATKCCYDSYFVYGIKSLDSIPEFKSSKLGTTPFALERFCNRFLIERLTPLGSCDAKMKNEMSKELDRLAEYDQEVVKLILKRDFACGINVSSINKAMPGLIFKYPVMLCEKFNEKNLKKIEYPAYAQLKLDGMRANIFLETGMPVKVRSRNGKVIETHGRFDRVIKSQYPRGSFVLDGELLVMKENNRKEYEPRKIGNGICNKAIRGTISKEDAARLVFVVWDVIPYNEWKKADYDIPYKTRFSWIKKTTTESLLNGYDEIRMVKTLEVNSFDEANRFYNKCINKGEEGIILKNMNSPWNNKRSKDQLKFKVENSADLQIAEVIEGTGKYEGMLGSFQCVSKDGIVEVGVGTGLSDEQRELFFTPKMIGKIVEVKYNEVITNAFDESKKSLFLPVFIEIREDKTVANTFKELK